MTPPESQIQKVSPSGDIIEMKLHASIRAGPWSEPDHIYVAPCGCEYSLRAYNRGEGWSFVCPSHRGNVKYIDGPEARQVLPYGCSAEEYLESDRSKAFMAFLIGQDWRPSTFEYGTNAGDYSSPLESRGGELWYHNVRQGCATKSALIARKVEEVVAKGYDVDCPKCGKNNESVIG